jgi:hypothetical protein
MEATDKEILLRYAWLYASLVDEEIERLKKRPDVCSLVIAEVSARAKVLGDEMRTLIEFLEDVGGVP